MASVPCAGNEGVAEPIHSGRIIPHLQSQQRLESAPLRSTYDFQIVAEPTWESMQHQTQLKALGPELAGHDQLQVPTQSVVLTGPEASLMFLRRQLKEASSHVLLLNRAISKDVVPAAGCS